MALRFIVGPAGSGKTKTCLNAIAEELRQKPQGPPLIFLVPEQTTFINEKELATAAGLKGSIRGQVLSFQRLLWRINSSALPWLDDIGKSMLIAQIVNRREEELLVFARTAKNPGFIKLLLNTIKELQKYKISPEDLAKTAQRLLLGTDATLGQKVADLVLVYRDMQQAMEGKYADVEFELAKLAESLKKADWLNEAEIWLDGFVSFTPVQMDIICTLAKCCCQVNVALCFNPTLLEEKVGEEDIFFEPYQTFLLLKNRAKAEKIDILPPLLLPQKGQKTRFQRPELAFLEANYYQYSAPVFKANADGICLVEAANKQVEVEWVAKKIIELLRDEGYQLKDISISVRNLADYEDMIRQVMAEFEIPCFLDAQQNLLFHPFVELVRSAIEVVLGRWDYEAVFRYFKTGLTFVGADEIDQLENYCLGQGIKSWHWHQEEAWQRSYEAGLSEAEKAAWLAKMESIRQQATKELLVFERKVQDAASIKDICQAIRGLWQDLAIFTRLEEWQKQATEELLPEKAREHALAWQKTEEILLQMESFLGEEKADLALFQEMLDVGLIAIKAYNIPPSLDQVFVADLQHSRTPNVKACFVLGCNEGVFPSKVAEDSIFNENERTALELAGYVLAPGLRKRQFAEQYLLYIALTRASEKLYLSYALADQSGRALFESLMIRRVRELFVQFAGIGGITFVPQEPPAAAGLEYLVGGNYTLNLLAGKLQAAWSKGEMLALPWQQAYNWYAGESEKPAILQNICHSLAFKEADVSIGEGTAQAVYGRSLAESSVSRLEAFNRCPSSYFVNYGLKLKERKQYKIVAPDLGTINHSILKIVGETMQIQGKNWADLTFESAFALVDEAFETLRDDPLGQLLESSSQYRHVKKQTAYILAATLLAIAKQIKAGSFSPVAWEKSFGGKSSWPAWVVPIKDGLVKIRGSIDRIDAARDEMTGQIYLRIIDFKLSQKELTAAGIYDGVNLQLPVYLAVAIENGKKIFGSAPLPAGMFYMTVQDNIPTRPPDLAATADFGEVKLKGLALLDLLAVQLADKDCQGYSSVLPVGITKEGEFYKKSHGYTLEQYDLISHYVRLKIDATMTAIKKGWVAPDPWQQGDNSVCKNCSYAWLCASEKGFNAVKTNKKQNDAQALAAMQQDLQEAGVLL